MTSDGTKAPWTPDGSAEGTEYTESLSESSGFEGEKIRFRTPGFLRFLLEAEVGGDCHEGATKVDFDGERAGVTDTESEELEPYGGERRLGVDLA